MSSRSRQICLRRVRAGKPPTKEVKIPCLGASTATKTKYLEAFGIIATAFSSPDGDYEQFDDDGDEIFNFSDTDINSFDDLDKAIKRWQEVEGGFSGSQIDGVLGPKSYKND